jgi:Domain of unknown function (DUF5667)
MNNFFYNLQNAARRTRLKPAEKQRMRVALYEAMKVTPAAAPAPAAPVKSPFIFVSLLRVRVLVPALAVLLVLAGSGTAYAAQGALPGSPLYAVKTGVDEPVRLALAATPQAKAQVSAQIAETRVAEAQALAAQGRLDATTSEELQQNFDEHAALALALLGSTTPTTSVAVAAETGVPAAGTASTSGRQPQQFEAVRAAFEAAAFSSSTVASTTASTTTTFVGEAGDIRAMLERQRALLESVRLRAQSAPRVRANNDDDATSTPEHSWPEAPPQSEASSSVYATGAATSSVAAPGGHAGDTGHASTRGGAHINIGL